MNTRPPRITTTEQAVGWLTSWDNAHLIPDTALPARPWRSASPRELASVADALLKVRAIWTPDGAP